MLLNDARGPKRFLAAWVGFHRSMDEDLDKIVDHARQCRSQINGFDEFHILKFLA
jgi:hypothetical protein